MSAFQKILIANRGEIAARIMRTCHRLGISTVAVFSEADREAVHVRAADEAVLLGPADAAESYLNIERIINAARQAGAQAIHPGYGFLAENAAFAEACAQNDLVFIGPPPQAIAAMGSKIEAKEIMKRHEVPVVPGYNGLDQSDEILIAEGEKIGFPLLVKAAAGGGGKGMRIVHESRQLPEAILSARREAEAAFGDGKLLLERYFESARHIEFQIFGDAQGQVIHLGERECSIQRRYQKIIEETPSPALNDVLRKRMGLAAVEAAKAIGYQNAGTVEFILTPEREFYFLEVNTRLQVEHPVTEAVLGLDLVEWQIDIAEGKPLPLAQEEIKSSGHALECRIYAEDPENNFLPDSGPVLLWEPGRDHYLRYDSAVKTGSVVDIHYDPMIAKAIAHGPNRETALRIMHRGLGNLSLLGLRCNQDFLRAVLQHSAFKTGNFDTHFLEKYGADLQSPEPEWLSLLAAAFIPKWQQNRRKQKILQGLPSGWRNNPSAWQWLDFKWRDQAFKLEYQHVHKDSFRIRVGEAEGEMRVLQLKGPDILLEIEGQQHKFRVVHSGEKVWIHALGKGTWVLELSDRFATVAGEMEKGTYSAPTPGKVLKVLVEPGSEISEGDPLVVLSSMKMENTLYAHSRGKVQEVLVEEGVSIEADTLLLRVES